MPVSGVMVPNLYRPTGDPHPPDYSVKTSYQFLKVRRIFLMTLLTTIVHGLCLFCKRLERGRFVWPQATAGGVHLSAAQLSMLLEGIDWRHTVRTAPTCAA